MNEGELLFDRYLEAHHYRRRHEPDYQRELGLTLRPSTRPDFLVEHDHTRAICEVRAFESSMLAEHLAKNRVGSVPPQVVFGPLRAALHEKARQLRPFANLGLPLVIVVANPLRTTVSLDDFHVTAAMFGNPGRAHGGRPWHPRRFGGPRPPAAT